MRPLNRQRSEQNSIDACHGSTEIASLSNAPHELHSRSRYLQIHKRPSLWPHPT